MGINHLAFATKDMAATHRFYTESMGFELVKVEVVPKPAGGFARHAFYSTGSDDDQLVAFWDLEHDEGAGTDFETEINPQLGLEPLTNHTAYQASDVDDLIAKRQRWLDNGHRVLEIDHGWVHSIYTSDPDGNAVEFAVVTRPFSVEERAEAEALLFADEPPPTPDVPSAWLHKPDGSEPTQLSQGNAPAPAGA
ncbi:MAG: VOC family protein [Actinomycetota bacterium]